MPRIIPHLWYDKEAKEAAAFYASVFPDSKVTHEDVLTGTPSGDCDIVSFEVMGQEFMAISAGPYFTFNPSISFMINFDPSQDEHAAKTIDEVWNKLAEGGQVLMPIQEYPFSKRYGWIQDKFGLSWQLILTNPEGEDRPRVIPSLLFVGDKCGKAEEAINFYLSAFKDSQQGALVKYPAGHPSAKEGNIMFADFRLLDTWLVAMDSGLNEHKFDFNEAVSLLIECDTQEEIDEYWSKLSAVPEAEQCGWLKDKFGVSWQVSPAAMTQMLSSKDEAAKQRVTQAFLKMKKFDLGELGRAYEGK